MKPLVSVIMPAYNAEKWIAEAIDSILNQTYENIELLVYNDGSTDGTQRIISNYVLYKNMHGNIKSAYSMENHGITWQLNQMIKYSKGKYIARMDADDIAMPQRIERQVFHLEKTFGNISAVGCAIELFGNRNTNKERPKWWGNAFNSANNIMKIIPYRNCLCHPSVMFRAEILKEYMYETNGAFQDYDLFLRMSSDGMSIGKVPIVLLKYRVRSASEASIRAMYLPLEYFII